MNFNRAYAFFLLVTVVGAFCTIKICNAAYSLYDYDEVSAGRTVTVEQ